MHDRVLPLATLAVILSLSACDIAPLTDSPLGPGDPGHEVAHLGDGGHPNFAFLEPLAKQVDIPDAFLPIWPLTVVICAHDNGAPDPSCGEGDPAHLITYAPQDLWLEPDRYRVDWPLEQSGAVGGTVYRIFVRYGQRSLGHADVALGFNMNEARNLANGDAIAVPENRTLPLAFHAGAIGCEANGTDCTERHYATSEPDILLTDDDEAAVEFPDGWYDEAAYPNGVTVIIEEKDHSQEEPCLPVFTGDQFGLCHTFETVPDNVQFEYDAVVAECMDEDALAFVETHGEVLQLAAYDANEPIRLLLNVPAPAGLDCSAYTSASTSWLGSTWRYLAGLLGPRPLAASHRGLGGLAGTFSDIGWVSTPMMEAISPLNHTVEAGETLPIGVRVYSQHSDDESGEPETVPVASYEVFYSATNGQSGSVLTGSNGEAWIDWTLPDPGEYTLTTTIDVQTIDFEADVDALSTAFGAGLNPPYPDPVLEFDRIESFTNSQGDEYWRWYFRVTNSSDYDDALFGNASLTCGANPDASRTWVDFENSAGQRVYRFCALGSASELEGLWFGRLKGSSYPAEVRIRMTDKVADGEPSLLSNYVLVPSPPTQ